MMTLVKLKLPLPSKSLVAIGVQLATGSAMLVEVRTAYEPLGVPPVPLRIRFEPDSSGVENE